VHASISSVDMNLQESAQFMSVDQIREYRQAIEADRKSTTEVHNSLSIFNREQADLQQMLRKSLKDSEAKMRNVSNILARFKEAEDSLTRKDSVRKLELTKELNYLISKHRVVTLMVKKTFPPRNRYNHNTESVSMSYATANAETRPTIQSHSEVHTPFTNIHLNSSILDGLNKQSTQSISIDEREYQMVE